jgi:hypothetical protein
MEFSDNESDNDIVGCKKQPRYTSPDHHAKLALGVAKVRRMFCRVSTGKHFADRQRVQTPKWSFLIGYTLDN